MIGFLRRIFFGSVNVVSPHFDVKEKKLPAFGCRMGMSRLLLKL